MTGKFQTVEEFERAFNDYMLDQEYSDYIMANCHGERIIGNGDALIAAMEEGYLYEGFKESMVIELWATT